MLVRVDPDKLDTALQRAGYGLEDSAFAGKITARRRR